jgi:hypothetical protein
VIKEFPVGEICPILDKLRFAVCQRRTCLVDEDLIRAWIDFSAKLPSLAQSCPAFTLALKSV